MASKGFGKSSDPTPPHMPSGSAQARDAASSRLDAMRGDNTPEYSVWLRVKNTSAIQDGDSPDFPWLPVGSMCIPRTAHINAALYNADVYRDLLSGARKLFPQLRKMEDEDIEVGYMAKDGADDDGEDSIRVANPPGEMGAFEKFQNTINVFFAK